MFISGTLYTGSFAIRNADRLRFGGVTDEPAANGTTLKYEETCQAQGWPVAKSTGMPALLFFASPISRGVPVFCRTLFTHPAKQKISGSFKTLTIPGYHSFCCVT
jgi:hypothetical protein